MNPIRQVIDDAPEFIQVPESLRHRRIELILWPLDEDTKSEVTDDKGWPDGFIESTFGSIPDFPEREPQGEYEKRLELE